MPKSMGMLTPTVASHNTETEGQQFGFSIIYLVLCDFNPLKGISVWKKYYLIYLVKTIQESIHKMWKKQHYFTTRAKEAASE